MLDGGVFTAISTTFQLVEFCYALRDVPSESLVFIRLIQRVREDLEECLRLSCIPAIRDHLDTDTAQKDYINGTIRDTREALAGIGKYVESVRTEEENRGELSMQTRFEWILTHQYKIQSRQVGLDTCHKSLLQAMSRLSLFQHSAVIAKGQNEPPSYAEITKNLDAIDTERADDEVVAHTVMAQDVELSGLLNTRSRRRRPGCGMSASEIRTNIPTLAETEWKPTMTDAGLLESHLEPPTRRIWPEAGQDWTRSYLHPNTASLGYELARPNTAASNTTGFFCSDEPIASPRLRSFSSSSSIASTAFTIASDARMSGTAVHSSLKTPPTPFAALQRPRSSHSTYPPPHQTSSVSELSQFRLCSQSLAPAYQTHHASHSVGSGISDLSLHSPAYSTSHNNFSVVSGFSELPAQSPRQQRYNPTLASAPSTFCSWMNDPDAHAPEVFQPPQAIKPECNAEPLRGPYGPTPDYSMPQVVPTEHDSCVGRLLEVDVHYAARLPVYPSAPVQAGMEVAGQPQVIRQPQRFMTPAQERREKNRARLHLIARD